MQDVAFLFVESASFATVSNNYVPALWDVTVSVEDAFIAADC